MINVIESAAVKLVNGNRLVSICSEDPSTSIELLNRMERILRIEGEVVNSEMVGDDIEERVVDLFGNEFMVHYHSGIIIICGDRGDMKQLENYAK